jgi:hypothetical protein
MTYEELTSGPEPPAPDIHCVHHWILGPPTYEKEGITETTQWVCDKCGAVRQHKFDIPFAERSWEFKGYD